jgi:uncharacterized protein
MPALTTYRKPADLPRSLAVFPLNGAVMFPKGQLPLNIFEPRYLNMIDDALAGDRLIGMIQSMPAGNDEERPGLARVGTVGRLTAFAETDDGRYLITLTGVSRFVVQRELPVATAYRQVEADFEPFAADLKPTPDVKGFDRAPFLDVVKSYLTRNDLNADWNSIEEAPAELLINALSAMCPFAPMEKQALLEQPTLADRQRTLETLMRMDNGDLPDVPMQ